MDTRETALVGAQVSDHVFLLMTDNAVKMITSSDRSIHLGTDIGVAVGPLGRSVEGNVGTSGAFKVAPIYTYSLSKGLYAGISVDGKVMFARHDVNENFYGQRLTPAEILGGGVPSPPAAQPLYDALKRCHVYATNQQKREAPTINRGAYNMSGLSSGDGNIFEEGSSIDKYSMQSRGRESYFKNQPLHNQHQMAPPNPYGDPMLQESYMVGQIPQATNGDNGYNDTFEDAKPKPASTPSSTATVVSVQPPPTITSSTITHSPINTTAVTSTIYDDLNELDPLQIPSDGSESSGSGSFL